MPVDLALIIRQTLCEDFDFMDEQILPASRLVQDLGLDEFDLIELAGALEEKLNVSVDSDRFSQVDTIAGLEEYLKELVQN